jgi:hypothetical protein
MHGHCRCDRYNHTISSCGNLRAGIACQMYNCLPTWTHSLECPIWYMYINTLSMSLFLGSESLNKLSWGPQINLILGLFHFVLSLDLLCQITTNQMRYCSPGVKIHLNVYFKASQGQSSQASRPPARARLGGGWSSGHNPNKCFGAPRRYVPSAHHPNQQPDSCLKCCHQGYVTRWALHTSYPVW